MQTTQNESATQKTISELLLEVHMRLSVVIGCSYGLISLLENDADPVTEATSSGLTFSLHETERALERLEWECRILTNQ